MKRAETLAAINRLEESFPVAEWTADGVAVWPVVRAALSWRSFSGYVEAMKHAPRPRRPRQAVLTRLGSLAADVRDRSHRATTRGRYDAIILGAGGVSRVWTGASWYDRLCDPFRELLARRGLSSLHLEPGRRFVVPRHYPSRYIQPALDVAAVRSFGPSRPSHRVELPGFDELRAEACRQGLDTMLVTSRGIARQVRLLFRMAHLYEALLTRTQARLAFAVSYELSPMAFNLACARMGVRSTEIQHGVQGPLHWAYSRWNALPPGGYELLPESYWVWSSEEASVIEDWAAPAFPRHRPVPGGNLWLDQWREGGSEVVREADERVRVAKERSPGERHVLIPLHSALAGRSSLEPFAAAIAARPTWRWWVRPHPGMTADESARAKRILADAPGARLEAEAAELPLYAVLRHVDAVATMASSVVIEAAAMGVPSAITDPDVGDQYAGETAAGWALVAEGSLAEALDSQMARAPHLPAYEKPRIAPEDALDQLLAAAGASAERSL